MSVYGDVKLKHSLFSGLFVGVFLGLALSRVSAPGDQVSSYWMDLYGLSENDLVFDFDGDGYSTSAEFFFGTDPFDSYSLLDPRLVEDQGSTFLEWDAIDGIAYEIEACLDLDMWEAMGGAVIGTGEILAIELDENLERSFYRFQSFLHDSDGDCLSNFEQIHHTGTDPNDPDSDGDGLTDGDEVKQFGTDPHFASPTGRGTIRGKVVYDEDGDPATRAHPGLSGWTIFLDKNLNGQLDAGEVTVETDAAGTFAFRELDPGYYRVCAELQLAWKQVFPETDAPYSADGYPDAVAEMVDSGNGSLPMPYGINKQSDVERKLTLGLTQEPVDPSIVLGQTPETPYTPPIALWSDVDFMGIPEGGKVTLQFANEEIIDGPGIDLVVSSLDQPAGEKGLIYLGRTLNEMQLVGQYDEGGDIGIDLEQVGIEPPIHFVAVEALDNLGAIEGFDLIGMEALNFQPPPRGHYDVTILGGDEVDGIDFGVLGIDRPPHVLVHSVQTQVREGDAVTLKVTASDDLGVVSQTLEVNGQPVALNAEGEAHYTTTYPGMVYVEAMAEDSAAQESVSRMQLLVLNADGTLPDLSGLGIEGPNPNDAPQITVFSPAVGEILEDPSPIVGTLVPSTTAISDWCVEYASTSLVDPENLEADDPDYRFLDQGSGTAVNQTLATFPADTLEPDTYLIRIKATGGTTAYFGFVVAVGLEELDIRPHIEITAPEMNAEITHFSDIVGSIDTRQTLREWSVEYAPLAEVNVDNLGDSTPDYTEIAAGTEPVTDAVLGSFDPSLLPNDSYLVRVTAWNTNGLGWTDGVILNVTGEGKFGNYAIDILDLSLPLAGIPIEVRRVYDSLQSGRSGDFGYGWRLGMQDADIRETVPDTGGDFLATSFKVGTRIYLTTPDEMRVGFTFDVDQGPGSILGTSYSAVFEPDPGVYWGLEVPQGDAPFLSVDPETGDVFYFFVPTPFNPDVYILIAPDKTRYTYDQRDGLVEIEDPNGNKVIYSESGIEHSAGPKVAFVRDGEGRITQVVDPAGLTWSYEYDTHGDLVQVTHPSGEIGTYVYDSLHAHFLCRFDDPLSQPTHTIEYDDEGRIAAMIDAAGNRYEESWNPAAFTGTYTDARGNITTIEHDEQGNVLREIHPPGGGETQYEYDDPSNPFMATSITDPNGRTTTFAYDENGNLIEQTDPLSGYVSRWEYDANSNLTRYIPRQGAVMKVEYDAAGNPTIIREGSVLKEYHRTYTESGMLATVLNPEGGLFTFEYDGPWGDPSKVTYPDGTIEEVDRNDVGQVIKLIDRTGAETIYVYDDLHRLVETIDAENGRATTSYHVDELVATETNRLNQTTQYSYTADELVKAVTLPDNTEIHYEYDSDGNVTAVVDALNNRTEYTYDALGRLIGEVDPSGYQRQYSYDLVGNLTSMTDRNGLKRSFIYDGLNRVIEERWHDASELVLRTIEFSYDKLNRLVTCSDPDASIAYSWDGILNGKLLSENVTYPGRASVKVNQSHDKENRRTRLGYTGSLNAARFVRDREGRLTILKVDIGIADAARVERELDGRGQPTLSRRFADVSGSQSVGSSRRTFDPRGWVAKIEHLDVGDSLLGEGLHDYTRNAEGEITRRSNVTTFTEFAYDAAGQLTSADRSSSSAIDEHYQYDGNGNRTSSHLHSSYRVGLGNRVEEAGDWSLTYDGEGNMTEKLNVVTGEKWGFSYDHRNRLTEVMRQLTPNDAFETLAGYCYDPMDRRIAVMDSTETVWTYYADVHPFLDFRDSETSPFRMYFYGDETDELVALWQEGEGTLWALRDHLGTVHRWLDRSGSVVGEFEYDSFGGIISATGVGQTLDALPAFTGRIWDAATGLYYYRARYYDPLLGRFLGEDPIGFEEDPTNPFRYVSNAPTGFTDPSGLGSGKEYALWGSVLIMAALDGAIELGEKFYRLGLWLGAPSTPPTPPEAAPPAPNMRPGKGRGKRRGKGRGGRRGRGNRR